MKKLLHLFVLQILSLSLATAQTRPAETTPTIRINPDYTHISTRVSDTLILAPLIFLASDKLKGRCIGSPGID